MASTNKTTNYELSQFLGTDKPAWLTDYNSDMSKIDTGIHTAQTTATGADGKADTANTSIGNLENLTTSVKTSTVAAINEVDGHADSAQETANTAQNTAYNASLGVSGLTSYITINDYQALTPSITTGTGTILEATVRGAYNQDKTLGKIYGDIKVNFSSAGGGIITIPTAFRPDEDIVINGGMLFTLFNLNGNVIDSGGYSYTLKTNGNIEIDMNNSYWGSGAGNIKISLINSILIANDFGDTPVNP